MKKQNLFAYLLLPFQKFYYFQKFIINHRLNNKFFFRSVFINHENIQSSAFLLDNFNNSGNTVILSKKYFIKKSDLKSQVGYTAQFTTTYYQQAIKNIKYFFELTNNRFHIPLKNVLNVFNFSNDI